MGIRPNPFRDPNTPGRLWLEVGDGVDPRSCHVLPLQGWDQINTGSMITGLALSDRFSPGGGYCTQHEVISMGR